MLTDHILSSTQPLRIDILFKGKMHFVLKLYDHSVKKLTEFKEELTHIYLMFVLLSFHL